MKIRNKNVIKDIAITTYKANWKRNLFTVFSIIVTTFMITAILSIAISYQKTISMRAVRMNGMSYDIVLTEPEEKQVEQVRAMNKVAKAGLSVKCAIGEKINGNFLDELQMYWLDQTAWEQQCIPALEYYEGSYPKEENEIMLSTNALQEMGIPDPEIGMKLPITWYSLSNGLAGESATKEFILCGFFKDYTGWERGFVSESFYRNTGARPTDLMNGKLMISLKNPLYSEKDIKEFQKEVSILPMQVVECDVDTISNFIRVVIVLFVLLLMIMVSGYLFIYNMLLISVSKDIICYGQLKTIGMTSTQLKSVVNRQVFFHCIVGIPLGLLFGIIIARVIVPAILTAADPMLETEDIVMVKPWICLIAVLFSLLTYWMGSRKPVRSVGKCSPIEAIRYTDCDGKKRKRSMSAGLMSMAWGNLFRSRRQTFIILLSFVISTAMVWVIQVVIQENNAERVLNAIYSYDIRLKNETVLDNKIKNLITDEKIEEVNKLEGIESVGQVISADAVVPYQEDLLGEYYKNLYKSRYTPGGDYQEEIENYKENPEESIFTSRIIGVDSVEFEKLNENLGNTLDRQKFESGETAVVISSFGLDMGDVEDKELVFWIPNASGQTEKQNVQIAAVGGSKDLPAYFSRGYSPEIIVSKSYLTQLVDKPVTELIEVSYIDPFSGNMEEQVKSIFESETMVSSDSKLERYSDMKKNSAQVTILGSSIGIIIVLLAFLNYINMITAGIESRRKEFAILESVGMTTKQIRTMLTLEGSIYAVISLLGGLAAGIPMSRLVFHNLNIYGMEYLLPWKEIIVSCIIILLLCIVIPRAVYYFMPKNSIIERIKMERD